MNGVSQFGQGVRHLLRDLVQIIVAPIFLGLLELFACIYSRLEIMNCIGSVTVHDESLNHKTRICLSYAFNLTELVLVQIIVSGHIDLFSCHCRLGTTFSLPLSLDHKLRLIKHLGSLNHDIDLIPAVHPLKDRFKRVCNI